MWSDQLWIKIQSLQFFGIKTRYLGVAPSIPVTIGSTLASLSHYRALGMFFLEIMAENTHYWGKHHCTSGLHDLTKDEKMLFFVCNVTAESNLVNLMTSRTVIIPKRGVFSAQCIQKEKKLFAWSAVMKKSAAQGGSLHITSTPWTPKRKPPTALRCSASIDGNLCRSRLEELLARNSKRRPRHLSGRFKRRVRVTEKLYSKKPSHVLTDNAPRFFEWATV